MSDEEKVRKEAERIGMVGGTDAAGKEARRRELRALPPAFRRQVQAELLELWKRRDFHERRMYRHVTEGRIYFGLLRDHGLDRNGNPAGVSDESR